ncbi:GDSL esterase/lipase [Prunus yedoensis var. nudiflora]|uniref:GDSL esterase/lipase n=1 Tax=Prunus yedoensis var. nudiflora TaxID=2094558 RepID=A0A314Z703_PRUYE|nr:GDSL esterase/lipase [Prunus yedoensis var. nudiflora]
MERVRLFVVVASILVMCVARSVGGEEVADTLSACDFPAIYNFGDSNSDTGGISAAFYPMASPCGETFFHRPAGRGCDGRLMIDFIDGVSPFSLDIQIAQYQQLKSRTTSLYNRAKKQPRRFPRVDDFSKALYTFDIGQNDVAAGIRKMSDEQFQAQIPDIINQLATAIRNLYDQGARTFWIHNTGPIGCLAVTLHYLHNPSPDYVDRRGCVKFQNDMARQFNRALKQKVFQLRKELPLAAITHVNVFAAKYKLLSNAKKHGFLDKTKICCGYHEDNNHVYCGNKGIINGTQVYAGSCEDPSLYISWDGVHYTEAANHWIANQLISGSFSDPPLPITIHAIGFNLCSSFHICNSFLAYKLTRN